MFQTYRRLLSHRGAPSLLIAGTVTRLSTPALSLALLLAVLDRFGSYSTAGLVLTGHALALALCAPFGGRMADRLGGRRALTWYLPGHALAYALLLSVQQAPPTAVVGAAVLLGATTPPVSAIIRGAWPQLVPAGSLPAAYAVDNAVNELMFIVGPLLVPLLLLALPAFGVVVVSGGALLLGAALLLASRTVRHVPPPCGSQSVAESRLKRIAGPLTQRSTLLLLTLASLGTFSFGCLRIGTVASSDAFGAAASAGVLMGLLSAGALGGTLAFGAHGRTQNVRVWLITLSVAEAASLLAGAFAPGYLPLAVLILVTGLVTGARDAMHPVLLAEHAPAPYRTEVFAWLNTFMWTGYSVGTAVAGQLTKPGADGTPAFIAAAAAALLAAILATALRPRPPASSSPMPMATAECDPTH
ncbi:MFS transporter [Actinomadura rudentiformis]|uniref:MFS transporter n=1 Tax=Actinomadura rudentiformis TaxID=359158 RepID=A0A6H9YXV7_9ACTN|nr:MFS transporter [Actinomadura rudentiformis]KAB2352284.1 MFS transporter [Actinomadura rudentiformis]